MVKKSLSATGFGSTGEEVTVVGLGGEGILRTTGYDDEAGEVIETALAEGVTYFDSARVYQDSELYYGTVWKADPERRRAVFQTSKSAERDRAGAMADLESTLKRLNTSYLDLWQIHDVRTEADLRMISGKGGALEAFVEARESGRVRFIGVTGHHDPDILARAVGEWPVDSVLMPVNPVEEILGGFLTIVRDAALKKGIAVIGMKILGAAHYIVPEAGITPEMLVRYALSHGIDTAIVGCSSPAEVAQLARVGRDPAPLSIHERREIMDVFRPYAGRMAFYRAY